MTAASQIARLQDEVYREMFRVEAGCASAELRLALALLRAWVALERNPPGSRPRQWLRRICPFCLRMIEAAPGHCGGPCRVENENARQHRPARSRRHA